jgi:hypothetical protein
VRASKNQVVQHAPSRPAGPQKHRRRQPCLGMANLGPAAIALITSFVAIWNISGPSFTRDEGATLLAAHRTFPQLVRMLGRVDVVHGGYYTLIWAVTRLAGSSEFAVGPGDAVLNLSTRTRRQDAGEERGFEAAYPYGLAALRDISQGATPAQSGTLGGTFASASVERQRLASVSRLWVVSWRPQPVQVLHGLGFTRLREWHISSIWIRLFIPARLTDTGERRTGRSACLQVTCLR